MSFTNINNLNDTPDVQIYQSLGHRDEQQDCYVVSRLDSGLLVAVADGHGGVKTASLIATQLPGLFHEALEAFFKENANARYTGLSDAKMRRVFRQVFQWLNKRTENEASGATLTMAFIERGSCRVDNRFTPQVRVTVGQMGDSVCALSTRPGHLRLAPLHRVFEAESDVRAIKQAFTEQFGKECKVGSGYIYSGSPGQALAVTRALGDCEYILVRQSRVKTWFAPAAGTRLLLASDGILTDLENPRKCVRGYVNALHRGETVEEIGRAMPYQHDNTTLIGVRFT